mmetsp:Transcript_35854/g.83428  ORF Transcript_35854/g.83428 Transcript_35854/m.83428 type:complete len:416 (-) Transcript_35854:132-1379(-)
MRACHPEALVCSDPPIWVFDGLFSDAVLKRVDDSFQGATWTKLNQRHVRAVELDVDEQLAELTQTLVDLSCVEEAIPCRKAWVMDVHGKQQEPHMDGWDLEKNRESLGLLDLSKCCVQSHQGFRTVIPTLSFITYFNDEGGCTFPHTALNIAAKRGRVIMFHNYVGLQRPAHNPAAVHFGVYGDAPKRVMTAGIMSSETPGELLGQRAACKTKGFLYAPIMHTARASCSSRGSSPPHTPPRPPPPTRARQLSVRLVEGGTFMAEARSLAGEVVAETEIDCDSTLGFLQRSLGLSPGDVLICGNEVLLGPDESLLREALLERGIDLLALAEEGRLTESKHVETGTMLEVNARSLAMLDRLRTELRRDLREELRQELRVELREELRAELREELRAELKELREELREEMHRELRCDAV